MSAVSFVSSHLSLGWQICVAGGDEIVGVALVPLQLFFDDDSENMPSEVTAAGKSSGPRLEWIWLRVNPLQTDL